MKQERKRFVLYLLSVLVFASGESALWMLFPSIITRLGGLNWITISLGMIYSLSFLVLGVYLVRFGQGKPVRRWHIDILLTYLSLLILLGLGFLYDSLLPKDVLFIWPFIILPLWTIIIGFYVIRKIPRVREKLDRLYKNG